MTKGRGRQFWIRRYHDLLKEKCEANQLFDKSRDQERDRCDEFAVEKQDFLQFILLIATVAGKINECCEGNVFW